MDRKVCRPSIFVLEMAVNADRAACSIRGELDLWNEGSQSGQFTKRLELLTREVAKDLRTPQVMYAKMVPNE